MSGMAATMRNFDRPLDLRGDRLLGRFVAVSRAKLREIRERLGVRRLVNLRGYPIR
jgi:hypothetical protein